MSRGRFDARGGQDSPRTPEKELVRAIMLQTHDPRALHSSPLARDTAAPEYWEARGGLR